jgi:hypothetical protein
MTIDGDSLNGADCVDHQARKMASEAYSKAADMLVEVRHMRDEVHTELSEMRRLVRAKLASVPDLVEKEISTNPNLRPLTPSGRAEALESAIRTLGTKWIAHIAIGAAGALGCDLLVRWLLATVFHH